MPTAANQPTSNSSAAAAHDPVRARRVVVAKWNEEVIDEQRSNVAALTKQIDQFATFRTELVRLAREEDRNDRGRDARGLHHVLRKCLGGFERGLDLWVGAERSCALL